MRGSTFFDGVAQVDVDLAGETGRLPIFYYDGSAMTALFPARAAALRALLPDPRFVPALAAPGVGLVGISTFEYRDTDIGAYNELAVSVVLEAPGARARIPGAGLVSALRRGQMHAYVYHLPVTTEIALVGGRLLYNYPKFVADIGFADEGDRWACRLEREGCHVLTLRARRIDARGAREMQVFSHLWQDRQPQSAEFKLNAHRFGLSHRIGAAELELGTGDPIGRELDAILLSHRSVHLQYLPDFEGILYGPDHLSLPLLARLRDVLAPAEPIAAGR